MKRTRRFAALTGLLLAASLPAQSADNAKMQTFIDGLMNRMTLEEKIGQLNLLSEGFTVTGPLLSKDVTTQIQ
jgi:beta-glucosidase